MYVIQPHEPMLDAQGRDSPPSMTQDSDRRVYGLQDLAGVTGGEFVRLTGAGTSVFTRIADELSLPPADIAYVGDRVDNDIVPAAAAGMCAIFLRRGPWAWIAYPVGSPPEASYTVETLAELPETLRRTSSVE